MHCSNEEIRKKEPPKSAVSGEKVLAVARRFERQRGLRGRQQKERCSPNRGGKNPLPSNMGSGSGSFSEATESNEKAMATGMMNLVNASKYVEQESNNHAHVAGN